MKNYVIGRLAYIANGVVKDNPYTNPVTLEKDLNKIANSSKPDAWFYMGILHGLEGETDVLCNCKFNKPVVWQKIKPEYWPDNVRKDVDKHRTCPDYLGPQLRGNDEIDVYWIKHSWQTNTGIKLIQNVIFGKNGGAIRWYDYD